jgi:D-xylose transport system ATP-binding protein
MLEVRLLTKTYSGIRVMDGVSSIVKPGEIPGYPGPNGAGRSTPVKSFQRCPGYVPEEAHPFEHPSGRVQRILAVVAV